MTDNNVSRLASWLEGEWDNIAQVRAEQAAGKTGGELRHRYAVRYTEMDTPAVTGHVFAIENYDDGNGFDGAMERVSVHRFMLGEDGETIIHEILFLKDEALRKSLVNDLSPLNNISEDDIRARESCRLYWSWTGYRFEGQTRPGACVTDSYTDEPITLEGFGALEANRLIRHDQNFRMSGAVIPRAGHETEDIFLRVTGVE